MTPVLFLSAYAADLIIGDPRWIPHPAVMIGTFIRWLEERICRGIFDGQRIGAAGGGKSA